MKKLILAAVAVTVGVGVANAQTYYTDHENNQMLHADYRVYDQSRREFVLPASVGGLLPLKTDLHVHSMLSDGDVTPAARVREAWLDGLDAIAITEHIEYHPYIADFKSYLRADEAVGNGKKAKRVADGEPAVALDHNISVRWAQRAADDWGILVIPGTEITRDPKQFGHWNALFTTDNNTIYNPDPLQAIRNAKAQGALVMYNHPGWWRTTTEPLPIELQVYAEGLVDGIEVNNGIEFYPGIIDRARERGLFAASNTDIHYTSAETYAANGMQRDMTIVFATDRSLPALRRALEQRQTVAYGGGGTLAGPEDLLRKLFDASVQVSKTPKGALQLTNSTSLQFVLKPAQGNPVKLAPMSSILVWPDKDGRYTCTLFNCWTGNNSQLKVELGIRN